MIYLTLKVLTNEHVGGLGGLYDKLRANEDRVNVEGNYMGSLLTFKSYKAAIFGVVLKVCNLALVTMDTAFWQKSFASDVRYATHNQRSCQMIDTPTVPPCQATTSPLQPSSPCPGASAP